MSHVTRPELSLAIAQLIERALNGKAYHHLCDVFVHGILISHSERSRAQLGGVKNLKIDPEPRQGGAQDDGFKNRLII